MKKIFPILLAVLLVLSVCPAVSSSTNNRIDDSTVYRWTNIDSITTTLSFSGTKANCSAKVLGKSGTTRITGTAKLERFVNGSYQLVKTWTGIGESGDVLRWSDSYSPVSSGYTYRFTFTANVTCNGTTETGSGWIEKYY